MPMLPLYSNRAPAVAGAFCLLLATALAGCASKNPLMEEPVPMASKAKPVAPAPAPAEVAVEAKPAVSMPTVAEAPQVAPIEAPQTPEPVAAAAPKVSTTTSVQTKHDKPFLGIFRPYRPDIQQGNFVSEEMVAQLKEGMTQDQVLFLLGTPLLTDPFHADRWDYIFRLRKGNGDLTTSRVTVFFKDKLVSSFEGGDLPTEKDYLARIADKAKAANK
jgi:outer membrane protein assembly factor BamE